MQGNVNIKYNEVKSAGDKRCPKKTKNPKQKKHYISSYVTSSTFKGRIEKKQIWLKGVVFKLCLKNVCGEGQLKILKRKKKKKDTEKAGWAICPHGSAFHKTLRLKNIALRS